ncbi:MAG: P-loop NTPase [Actinomycetota bacterium]|nr:P-loop NTPase [Actinomycetota bacterium]
MLVAAAVFAWFSNQPKVYQAQAQLSVTPAQVGSSSGTTQSDTLFLAATYAQLGTTSPVVGAAVRDARLHLDYLTAAKRLSVTASSNVAIISVTATGPSPGAAVALARSEADALTAAVTSEQEASVATQLKKVEGDIVGVSSQLAAAPPGSSQQTVLQAQLQALEQLVTNRQSQPLDALNVVGPARGAASPVSPRPARDAVLGLVTALVVASELAVLLEALSDRFPAERLEDEVIKASGLVVLAHIPNSEEAKAVEAFRKVRTSLLFMGDAERVRTVAVVGSEPGAGKSFLSIGLASAVAELGVCVVLVDGDMRRPVIHERLGVPRFPGLSDVLAGKDADEGLHPLHDRTDLLVMPAGEEVADPSGLLARGLARRVIVPLSTTLPANTELLVLDTPPEALFPDALTIAAQCDATIVVVDARSGRRRSLRRTLDELRQVGATPLGIVLNRSSRGASNDAYYSYGAQRKGGGRRRKRIPLPQGNRIDR